MTTPPRVCIDEPVAMMVAPLESWMVPGPLLMIVSVPVLIAVLQCGLGGREKGGRERRGRGRGREGEGGEGGREREGRGGRERREEGE